jgi:hypothetical protein
MRIPLPATPVVLFVGASWIAIPLLGMSGRWFAAVELSIAMLAALVALGCARRGTIAAGFVIFPIATWAAVSAIAFALARRDAGLPGEEAVAGAILGFHPSFAWIVLGYWLAGVAVLAVGFHLRRDEWLPESRWRELRATLDRLDDERREGARGRGD